MILISGAAASGKSELSGPLARRLGLPLTLVDDLMIAAKTLSTPAQQPALHAWDTVLDHTALTPEDILAMHLASARTLQPALEVIRCCPSWPRARRCLTPSPPGRCERCS